jgi:histone acetyltransferase (RNA polymerase elongator complex component)
MKRLRRFIVPIFIPHAGCPHRCIFCDQRAISGAGADPVTPEFVRRTVLRHLMTRPGWTGERELAFFGGSFTTLPEERQKELLRAGTDEIASGNVDALRVSTRPDGITGPIVARLARSGVRTVELGVQSMDDEILSRAHRGHTAKDSVLAARLLREAGLSWIAQIMPGLPGDDDRTMIETARRVADLSPDGVRIYPAVVIEGTRMARMYRAGEYAPLTLRRAVEVVNGIAEVFERRSIPIIRIGLPPSEGLSGRVVAGPYHPAFGAFVYEARLFDAISSAVDGAPAASPLVIRINPRDLSRAVGNRRSNVKMLADRYPSRVISFSPDPAVARGEVRADGV